MARIYRQHKIRKKKVKMTKILNRNQRRKIKRLVPDVRDELNYYKSRGFRIIYLDEMMVTKSTMQMHEWSQKNFSYKLDFK